MKKYGNDKTFNVIKQCIPTDTKLPILHHGIKDAPQFMNDFTSRYPSALYHRDKDGRTLTQAALTSGAKTFKNDSIFIGKMTDDEIAELDPVTNQYPFLTCATHESSDYQLYLSCCQETHYYSSNTLSKSRMRLQRKRGAEIGREMVMTAPRF